MCILCPNIKGLWMLFYEAIFLIKIRYAMPRMFYTVNLILIAIVFRAVYML